MAKPPSPKQQAVRLYGKRLFATGCTQELIKNLRELGFREEANMVHGAQILLRVEALKQYEAERLRLDPNFETDTMLRQRQRKELEDSLKQEEASISHHMQWT